ncbi:hypothetical protein, partial [Stutzerimonas nitrititolerans]|uniref:hypothetical protein n=1 Tax=Stutzerimonas nitrititolerans TaxID=2482751 RepID=UPI0028ABBA62
MLAIEGETWMIVDRIASKLLLPKCHEGSHTRMCDNQGSVKAPLGAGRQFPPGHCLPSRHPG